MTLSLKLKAQGTETKFQLKYDFENVSSRLSVLTGEEWKSNDKNLSCFYTIIEGAKTIDEIKIEKTELNPLQITRLGDFIDEVPEFLLWKSDIGIERKRSFTFFYMYPLIKENGKYFYVKEVNLVLQNSINKKTNASGRSISFTNNSVLSQGEIYKIGLTKDGVYEITSDLLSQFGLSPSSVDPSLIQVFGAPAGMIDKNNTADHYDDLMELSVKVIADNDGSFESNEKVLFYGQAPDQWRVNDDGNYYHTKHLYSDSTYYFVKIGSENSKQVEVESSSLTPDTVIRYFDELKIHEEEWTNLIKTGSKWLGEPFEFETNQTFSFSTNQPDPSFSPLLKVSVAARAVSGDNSFAVRINGTEYTDISVPLVSGVYYSDYAKSAQKEFNLTGSSSSYAISLSYSKPQSNSLAWLDYITLHSKTSRTISASQEFVQLNDAYNSIISYELPGNAETVWDVTDNGNIIEKIIDLDNGVSSFSGEQDTLRKYVVFNSLFLTPGFVGKVENQNLHGLSDVDYIIVTSEKLKSEATRLAEFHQGQGLSVEVLTQNEIFNEFSSGAQDVMAIRKFLKMLYDRANTEDQLPDYLLMFGDGSYDPKSRIDNNTNEVICYQSANSFEPTQSYVSDDFFVLLDDNEGEWSSFSETIDMGVGRFPISSLSEARILVNKSISYSTPSEENMGDWRSEISFIADDEDGNTHLYQSDFLSDKVSDLYPELNSKKIFFDAYKQESGPGGDLYPDVNNAINQTFQNGALIVNYTGHGGEVGWAHERVLGFTDIDLWENEDRLPLVMTATCEFSRYDDPSLTSAGEEVLLSEKGGCIAMFTTVRLVFSSPNFVLNQHFYDHLIDTTGNERRRFGDIYRLTKRASGGATNHRNFTLLGDPALYLAYPQRKVITTKINGSILGINDTLKSLSVATIEGSVLNSQGEIDTDFNGVLVPTIYDKPSSINTLANDGGSVFNFESQENIVFKGNVTVTNGVFSFDFMVPKDISFNQGFGKISYYVSNDQIDGIGSYDEIVISGTSDSVIVDNIGPEIEIKFNDEQFVDGGVTDESPLLLVLLSDSSGINTVGNGIGHDITAIIDDKSANAIVLNDFYESDLDSYQSGQVNYQLFNMETGDHSITIKAWDVHNNSSERSVNFLVHEKDNLNIDNVFNYPNPFTTNTSFYFDHNQINEPLDVQIQIMTVSGRLVKTLNNTFVANSFKGEQTPWDGLDDYGDALARGVYIYKLTVTNSLGEKVSQIEKLVVLK